MNDETRALSAGLQRLADDMTPPLDVVAQVRAARSRHRRRRQGRIAVLVAASAAAAVVVGSVAVADVLSAEPAGQVARPGVTAPATTAPVTSTAPATTEVTVPAVTTVPPAPPVPSGEPSGPGPAADWEPRTFAGVRFEVPPGARSADTVEDVPVTSWMDGPSLTWNGPLLDTGEPSYVRVTVVETFDGGLTPSDGGDFVDVPGADTAYVHLDSLDYTGAPLGSWNLSLSILDGDRQVLVHASFPAGPGGEAMAQRLLASVAVG